MGMGTIDFRQPKRREDEERIKRQIELRPPKLGVVIFNNAASPTSGVAAVAGRAPIVFESRSELPSDILWISTAQGATTAQTFRSIDFLRVKPFALAEDLGVQLEDVMVGLPEVAKTIGSIRDIVAQAYAWNDFSTDWSQFTLAAAIAKILPSRGAVAEATESPLSQALQSFSVVQEKPAYTSHPMAPFTLRLNRLGYAQWLLSGEYPVGAWHYESGNLTLDRLLDPSKPCLVEASIEFPSSTLPGGVTPALIAFGSSSYGGGKETIRRWISQPELAWLTRYARVHVVSAMFCRDAQKLSPELALPPMLLADPLLNLSVAAGVAAELHWNALAMGSTVRRTGNGGAQRFVMVNHPLGVWLRALDRAYCFAMAKKAASMGFMVSAYGYGSISVWSHKDDLMPLFDLSAALDCCHPNLAAMCERVGFDPLA